MRLNSYCTAHISELFPCLAAVKPSNGLVYSVHPLGPDLEGSEMISNDIIYFITIYDHLCNMFDWFVE